MLPEQFGRCLTYARKSKQFTGKGALPVGPAVPADGQAVGGITNFLQKEQLWTARMDGQRIASTWQKNSVTDIAGSAIRCPVF